MAIFHGASCKLYEILPSPSKLIFTPLLALLAIISALITGFFILAKPAPAYAEPPSFIGYLMESQTWTPEGGPYVIKGPDYVSYNGLTIGGPGVTLTIEPGTVVKFERWAKLDSGNGKIIALGTADQPIIFTSIYDDTVGGDTDGDGGATQPQRGDWADFFLNANSNHIEYMEFRYGSGCTRSNYSDAVIKNNKYFECHYGVWTRSQFSGLIEGNEFKNNGAPITTDYWGEMHETMIRNNKFLDNGYGLLFSTYVSGPVTVTGNDFINNNRTIQVEYGKNIFVNKNNFIGSITSPGIWNSASGADYALDARDNWWGDPSGPYNPVYNPSGLGIPVHDNIIFSPWLGQKYVPSLDPVIIIPGINGSQEKNGVWVMDPIFHTYDNLIDTFKANGYEEGKNLFTFPYDWGQSNATTALELEAKTSQVRRICNCSKVDIVAHSMGGLVARQYIESNRYQNDVDQLIFLGTPHLGAPKSYLTWEGGEIGPTIEDSLEKFFYSRQAKKSGYPSIFEFVRNRVPSVKELLPVYDYIKDEGSDSLRTYPDNYPQNTFLENLNNYTYVLLNSDIKMTNIVGDAGIDSTISYYIVTNSIVPPLWEDGYPVGFHPLIYGEGIKKGAGDGTVPYISSTFIDRDLNFVESEHGALPTQAEGLIYKKLTGNEAATLSNTHQTTNYKLIIIKLLSPVDMVIIAPNGDRIGKDFLTGEEVNEIPDAFYSGFQTDDEYITIPFPLDGEYKIETQGTGAGGEYTVSVAYITDEAMQEKDYTSTTAPGQITDLSLNVDNTNPENLNIELSDQTPPVIQITSPEARNYQRSEILPIDVTVTDSESGVASSEIKFDDTIVNDGKTVDLFFKNLGSHTLSVQATDVAGNSTSQQVSFRVIATLSSTLSDIDRAYLLGWIDDAGIRDSLKAKLREDKIMAKAFLNELYVQRDKHISNQAYELLYEDINWLINNL